MSGNNLPTQVPSPTTSPSSTSLVYIVDSPYGTPADNATTNANLVTKAHGLSDTTVLGVSSGVIGATSTTGSGNVVLAGSPTLTSPALGTPSALVLTNATGAPTWNQNTTGSAASLSISGQTGLLTVTGLTSTNRAKTVRDAADTLLELGGTYTPSGTWTWTSASVTWPTFNQNTTGTASNVSGTPALPNGTTATTQSAGDNTTKLATDAFVTTAVQNGIAGLSMKDSVVAATTGSETFTIVAGTVTVISGTTLDGQSPSNGDRILIKDAPASTGTGSAGSTQPGNGIYTVTSNVTNLAVSRSSDMSGSNAPQGAFTFVEGGSTQVSTGWTVSVPNTDGSFTYGTNNIKWTQFNAGGGGGVSAVSIATANGFSGSSSGGSTPALTIVAGAITPTTVNGLTISTTTGTLTMTNSKTLAVTNTLTLAGTDSTTMTFPATSATIARTDAANTFTGHQTIEGVTSTGATGTGKFVFDTSPILSSPTFTTPVLGTPSSGTVTNLTGTASININGTVGATTPTTGSFTSSTCNVDIYNNNAVSVSSNAGTCSVSYRLNTFTNSSAATMAITIATSGATDGQLMMVRIYDFSAVSQTIGWTNTENSTVAAPTTSNGSTTLPLTVGFQFNGQTSKWRCIALA